MCTSEETNTHLHMSLQMALASQGLV